MPKTVLIILAAVVALIVIVILTGMRYLRADDEDDFDDDRPAEHGRSPSRGGHPKSSQARARQAHPMELADERRRDRSVAARGTRPAQGRDDRGQDRHGFDQRGTDPRRTDPRLPSRADQDRSWREDSAITSRGGRGGLPVRDPRPARTARRDRDDVSGPLPAARTTRASAARGPGGDDYDSLPGRRASTGEFARQPRDRRNGRDRPAGYEADLGGRGDGRDPREIRDRRPGGDAANSRESRNGRDRTDPRDSRPMASIRNDTDSDIRNRRTSTGPNARPSGRKNGSKPNDELLPAVKPRQSKNKRESNGDWLSDEWDELEDVDYWTELASDGPFSSSSAETPRSARRDRADGGAVPDRAGRADRDGRADRESRPGRDARKDSRIGDDAITKQMSRPPREPDSGLLPAARHRDLPADRPAPGRSADPRPAIADNDPLTSPSFPSVASDDSRSYRRSRSGRSDSRHERGRRSDSSRQAAASDRGSGDRSSYPSMPPVDPVRGFDNASTTRRHSQPAATASDLTAASAGYAAGNGDHYGSQLPGTPAHPASSATSGYQAPAASGTYQTPGASYAGQEGANGSYPLPARYSESGGYQAAASYPPPVSGAYPQANGSSGNSYLPSAGGSSGLASGAGSSYESLPPGPGAWSELSAGSQQGGAGYESTGYGPASSYPPASSAAGYSNGNGNGNGHRAAEYPGNGYQAGEYPGYGASTSHSGSHRRPEPGYTHGNYQGAADASLPAATPDGGYASYPAPAANGQNGYGGAAAQPGHGAAQYQQPGYEQAGYPQPAPDANGYGGADPYAADPYGQRGHGGNGY